MIINDVFQNGDTFLQVYNAQNISSLRKLSSILQLSYIIYVCRATLPFIKAEFAQKLQRMCLQESFSRWEFVHNLKLLSRKMTFSAPALLCRAGAVYYLMQSKSRIHYWSILETTQWQHWVQTNWLLTESVKSSVLKIGPSSGWKIVCHSFRPLFNAGQWTSLSCGFLKGNGSVFHVLLRRMSVKEEESERAYAGAAAYDFSAQCILQAGTSECKIVKNCVQSQCFCPALWISLYVCKHICLVVHIFLCMSLYFLQIDTKHWQQTASK